MRKRIGKRLVSAVLAVSMIVSMMPVQAFAKGMPRAESTVEILKQENDAGMTDDIIEIKIGSGISFGEAPSTDNMNTEFWSYGTNLLGIKTLTLKNSVFVLAARNIGVSDARILFHHILPGAIPDIIVQYSMSFGSSILTASSLSFLGMGAQPPTPEWGLLLSNGRNYMTSAMYVTIFPGLAIFLTVLSFNLLGDGLRDALDPKLSD